MNIQIFIEGGGGDNEDTTTRCRRAFAAYCAKAAPGRPPAKILPCGGRDQAFKDFAAAVRRGKRGELYALLVDSEAPLTTPSQTEHLVHNDKWKFPPLNNHRVFLMVQAMEAWFLADRATLRNFYGDGFRANSLPGSEANIESIRKDDLEPSLKRASRDTTKSEYHKTKHGFALLALIDPAKVENASPNAAALHQFLREQIP